ncbi:MAG: DUF6677 family protein [Thermoanaerobaculia bacterium]
MTEAAKSSFPTRALLLAALAWILPSFGHFLLGKRLRALGFALVMLTAFGLGLRLEGNLYRPVAGQPLSYLATLGAMGVGAPYFIARYGAGYRGTPEAQGFEYGTVFLLSAGLMNLLLVLDVWDIANGREEKA